MTNLEFSGLLNELAGSGASAKKAMDFFRTHIDDLSLERLNQLIDTVSVKMNSSGSVVDFPTEMVTCLYSGYMEDVRTQDYVSKMSDVRILDNTHAANFLDDKEFEDLLKKLFEKELASGKINENNVSAIQNGIRSQEDKDKLLHIIRKISDDRESVTNADILQAAKIAANGYVYEPSKGAWAIISENFVKATSPNSEIICITPEADLGRTWALVEIPTVLEELPDSQKVFGRTVGELKDTLTQFQSSGYSKDEAMKHLLDSLELESKQLTNASTIYYDDTGKIKLFELPGSDPQKRPVDSAFSATIGEIGAYADDVQMAKSFGVDNFAKFSNVEKLQARQIDFYVTKLSDFDGERIPSKVVDRYLEGSKKTIGQLDKYDNFVMNLGMKIGDNSSDAAKLFSAIQKYDGVIKSAERVGGVVDLTCTTLTLGRCIYDATQAYKEGDTDKAAAIIAGEATDFTLSFVGGSAITSTISPYLVGLGTVVGGPFGAAIGGVLAGVIGYGLAGWAADKIGDAVRDGIISIDYEGILAAQTIREPIRRDPLILDLDGDGKYSISVNEGTHFDFSGDGFAEKTGWVSKNDGFLVRDLNENGIVDDGSELFSDKSKLANGSVASDGFQALRALDSNKDSVIDSDDTSWKELKIWIDSDSDGFSQNNELHSLEEFKIKEISLKTTLKNTSENGNLIANTSSFIMEDGTTHSIAELKFDIDTMNTVQKDPVNIPDTIKALPNLVASGNMLDLHQAMVIDNILLEMVEEFSAITGIEQRIAATDSLLKRWAGCANVPTTGRGSNIDASRLAVIEKFYGRGFAGANGANPNSNAAPLLNKVYEKLLIDISSQLIVQTQLRMHIAMTYAVENKETGQRDMDFSFAKAMFNEQAKAGLQDTQLLIGEYVKFLKNSNTFRPDFSFPSIIKAFSDSKELTIGLYMSDISKILNGSDNNDNVSGSSLNDAIFAMAGNDYLYGGDGNDVLSGGSGNDTLTGGIGNDIYLYSRGDGVDVISDYSGDFGTTRDMLRLTDIRSDEVEFIVDPASANNLKVVVKGTTDGIIISGYFRGESYQLEQIEFADGVSLGKTELWEKVTTISQYGTEAGEYLYGVDNAGIRDILYGRGGNDYIWGKAGDDTFYGETGNDTLSGGAGNDVLSGGTGADTLLGEAGNDTYIYSRGDGADTINDNSSDYGTTTDLLRMTDIRSDEVEYRTNGDNLVICVKGTGDSVTVSSYFTGENYRLEQIEYSDGVSLSKAELWEQLSIPQSGIQGRSATDYSLSQAQVNLLVQSMASLEGSYGMASSDSIGIVKESRSETDSQIWIRQVG